MKNFLDPLSPSEWDRQKARHLLNRAGFGIPFSQIAVLTQKGLKEAVSSLFQNVPEEDSVEPQWLKENVDSQEMMHIARLLPQDETKMLKKEINQKEMEQIAQLKAWWFHKMRTTSCPLQEKMALFWHGHFATSAEKVKSTRFNYDLNQIFRKEGLGNFKNLVTRVGQSPAMLIYLDNMRNNKRKPNENWARELMELFTLGIGNYQEKDIKEAARAFTGWTHHQGTFVHNRRQHDEGTKTFLGKTGPWEGQDIIDILFEQEALTHFIPKKIWEFFVYENPEPELLRELSALFLHHRFEITPFLKTIFLSQAFYSAKAIGTQIKSPVQLIVGLLDSLKLEIEDIASLRKKGRKNPQNKRQAHFFFTQILRQMGQDIFFPPNVKGWEGNRTWINTNTLFMRYNLSALLVNGFQPQRIQRLELDETEETFQKRQKFRKAFQRLQLAPFEVEEFFSPYEGFTLGEVLDFLIDYFLGYQLDSDQKEILLQAFSPGGKAEMPFALTGETLPYCRGVVHLLLSLAEYQLC